MMPTLEASYQQFSGDPDDSEETPQEFGAMIHIVPETGKSARWNHVEDLDSFFMRIYLYHQKHGFACMMLQLVLDLVQFIFILIITTFVGHCVDYGVLFKNKPPNGNSAHNSTYNMTGKITIRDVVIPTDQCVGSIGFWFWLFIFISMVFWIIRAIRVVYHLFQFWNIKAFFNTALRIQDAELDNVTWHDVQKRIREVQLEQQMCIHKKDLTEIDIYHRILRFKNYMVAMINKSILTVEFKVPLLGRMIYFTNGYKYNINFLLFWGPWSPFQNNWHLKEDFKKANKRQELAQQLSKLIFYTAIANLVLSPLILIWQILYFVFANTESIRREPGFLGARCWSQYGRLYLRHFNELDHELNARLNRAYRQASKYMNTFTSPFMVIIAKNIVFMAGAILAVLVPLSAFDEDVLTVEHVLTIITICAAVIGAFSNLIPDENMVSCPEQLMMSILQQVQYVPDNWCGNAHTTRVRHEFSQLFQYKATYLLEELLSAVVTPVVLLCYLRPKALDIVDFFRHFTVEVVGVGDVCSFAQMDVRRHGNPTWQTDAIHAQPAPPNQYDQAEDGKTELSLIHFARVNPEWKPPTEADAFISAVRTRARTDEHVNALHSTANLLINDSSLASIDNGPNEMLARPGPLLAASTLPHAPVNAVHMHSSRAEGPIHNPQASYQGQEQTMGGSGLPEPDPMTDMSLSTLYLHQIHYRQMRRRGYHEGSVWSRGATSSRTQERTPLISRPS